VFPGRRCGGQAGSPPCCRFTHSGGKFTRTVSRRDYRSRQTSQDLQAGPAG
jgi:hypothetical protein